MAHLLLPSCLSDANGSYVVTDGTSDTSPKISFAVDGIGTLASWNQATDGNGDWTEFSRNIVLPLDSSSAWKARIIIDKAQGKEFHIKG